MIIYAINTITDEVKEFEAESFASLSENYNSGDWREATQEEVEPVLLKKVKDLKIQELEQYHYNDPEIRILTINSTLPLSLDQKGRDLVAEQIRGLELQVKQGQIVAENATFEYFFEGGSQIITCPELEQLYIIMMSVVNGNYATYKSHSVAIKAKTTIEEIELYDFKAGYIKNQNINL